MNIADIAAIVNAGGGGGAGGGGSAYDFIIRIDITTSTPAYSLYSGDFDAVAKKLNNHEMVMGYLCTTDRNEPMSGQAGFFSSAFYIEADDTIATYWHRAQNMAQVATLTWQRDGTIFEE